MVSEEDYFSIYYDLKEQEKDIPEHALFATEKLFSMLCETELDSDQMDDAFGFICAIRDYFTFDVLHKKRAEPLV